MSRIFVKQVPRLVRQYLPNVQNLCATSVVEAMEDISHLKRRDESVETYFTHCISRALALLPELRMNGVIRALFAYKRAKIKSQTFINEISQFLVDECIPGRPFEHFLGHCTANDILLLYKAFAVNEHFNLRLYGLCTEIIEAQNMHMIPSDCCVFFQAHMKYLDALRHGIITDDNGNITIEDVIRPSLALKVTMRFLNQRGEATPEDLTVFTEWLATSTGYYGLVRTISNYIAAFCQEMAQKAVIFNINHIHRMIQSCCHFYIYMPHEHYQSVRYFIASLLQESERRCDLQDYSLALQTFYALDRIGFWEFELLQGVMYSIVNNVKNMEDLEKIKSIIQSRLRKISEADDDNKKDEKKSMIDLYPAYARNRKLHEIIERLETRQLSINT